MLGEEAHIDSCDEVVLVGQLGDQWQRVTAGLVAELDGHDLLESICPHNPVVFRCRP